MRRRSWYTGSNFSMSCTTRTTVTDVLKKKAEEQKMFSVQAVRAAFGAHYMEYGSEIEEALFEGSVSMLTHDALIGVMDRHHENWGVIVRRELGAPPPRFSPLYDSARGLFCNWGDEGLARFNEEKGSGLLDSCVSKARPLVGFLGLEANGRSYVTHPELLAAVFHCYPQHRSRIAQILGAYDWKAVRNVLERELGSVCSANRRTLILVCLRRRNRAIWRAIDRYQA